MPGPKIGGGGGRGGVTKSDVTGRFGYAKFSSAGAAIDAAMMLGINGFHSHQMEGNTIYMPGNNHRTLNDALSERGLETTMVPGSGSGGMGSGMMSGGMGSSDSEPGAQGMMMGQQPDDMMPMPEMEDDMQMPDLGVEPADPGEMELAQGPEAITPSLGDAPETGMDMGAPEPDLEMPEIDPFGETSSHNDDDDGDDDDGTLYTS